MFILLLFVFNATNSAQSTFKLSSSPTVPLRPQSINPCPRKTSFREFKTQKKTTSLGWTGERLIKGGDSLNSSARFWWLVSRIANDRVSRGVLIYQWITFHHIGPDDRAIQSDNWTGVIRRRLDIWWEQMKTGTRFEWFELGNKDCPLWWGRCCYHPVIMGMKAICDAVLRPILHLGKIPFSRVGWISCELVILKSTVGEKISPDTLGSELNE